MRAIAAKRGILIGAAVNPVHMRSEPAYAQTLGREFGAIVAENAMKFGPLRPTRSTFKFDDADLLVEFAQTNSMEMRGHTLVWHSQNPRWLTDGTFTRDELVAILREHITTVITHYRGQISAWDVVNEAIADDGSIRETLWSKGIGNDYVDLAFRFAREADPNVKLIYNDYNGEGLGRKSDAIYNLVKGFKERGVPIDGVGFQSHFRVDTPPRMADVDANMRRLSALGLEVHITELDVRTAVPSTEARLTQQAAVYREYLQTCLANSNCKMFVLWGFTDKYSWIPAFFPGEGSALIFDEQYKQKAAYQALLEILGGR